MFCGWVFFLVSLGSPHVLRAHMGHGHTCGEPNEIGLTAAHGLYYRSFQAIDVESYCDWGVDYLKIDQCQGQRYVPSRALERRCMSGARLELARGSGTCQVVH